VVGSQLAVGIVSPGEMGSALGSALRQGGARVLASVAGRSQRTVRLAEQAGLELIDDLDEVIRQSSVLLSVVPPQHARAVIEDLVARATRLQVHPLVVDLNATDPDEVAELDRLARSAQLQLVDGALSGAPPRDGAPRGQLLLSGPAASVVAELPWRALDVSIVGPRIGAASAVKMCMGGVRKGMSALVVNALLTAAAYDVLEPVEAGLRRTLQRDPVLDAELAASKAWRFVPEMEAVARTQEAVGVDPAVHRAIAEVFRRTATSPLAGGRPEEIDRTEPPSDPGQAATRRAGVVSGLVPAGAAARERHPGNAEPIRADRPVRRVAVVGLGRMGAPIAAHLVGAGHDVVGLDPDPGAGADLPAALRRVTDPAELDDCEVVLLMAGGSTVRRILLDGERLRPVWRGRDVLVCSTVDPLDMAELHAAAAHDGGRLLDAPLCRGDHGARQGDLLALVGGDAAVLGRCEDVLRAFCSDIVLVGGPTAGQTAKLVNNMMLWSTISSAVEGLRLAEAYGVRREPLLQGLLKSSAASWVLETWARPRELPWAEEDMRMVLEAAGRTGTDVPVSEVVRRVIGDVKDAGALSDGGLGDRGWSLPARSGSDE
jgi:3-hydroxyisobutyrate dehydrogenase-like beta-hydroxyacid dehydrogenase